MLDIIKPGSVISSPETIRSKVSVATPPTSEEDARLIENLSRDWEALPVAATRSIAPVALLWLTWWELCAVLIGCSMLWVPFRTWLISLQPAMITAFFNHLLVSVPANVLFAVTYFASGATTEAVVSLFWYGIAGMLALACPRPSSAFIRRKLRRELTRLNRWSGK